MRPYKFRMRLSSRRLNVTRFGTAPTATWCAAARDSLGSRSSEIKLMVRLLAIFDDDMIAPTASLRKGRISVNPGWLSRFALTLLADSDHPCRHGIVS